MATTHFSGPVYSAAGFISGTPAGSNTATATAGAATLNTLNGSVTTEALTTAAAATYTLTLTDSQIVAGNQVIASLSNGTNTTAGAYITTITTTVGQTVIVVKNGHATAVLNGTLVITFQVI